MNFTSTKYFYLFLFSLFLQLSFAQSSDNPWKFSLGVNVIDTYPTGDSSPYLGNAGDLFEDFFNVGDHWNLGGPSASLSRFIGAGFSLGLQGGINTIEKINGVSNPSISSYSADAFF